MRESDERLLTLIDFLFRLVTRALPFLVRLSPKVSAARQSRSLVFSSASFRSASTVWKGTSGVFMAGRSASQPTFASVGTAATPKARRLT